MRRTLALLLAGLSTCAAGCGGDQHWTKDSNWQGDDAGGKRPRSTTIDSDDSAGAAPASITQPPVTQTWFGVRHDLTIRPDAPRAPACGCLAVELGAPGKQAFLWDGAVPSIGDDAIVVAVSARGVQCPAEPDEGKRRASISAVDRDGEDVVIEIEDLPEGRPLALGAIVPRPGSGGALYLQPRNKNVRWVGQGASKRCKVKSPAAAP